MRFRELPGFPALFVDYVEGEKSARDFFPWTPDAESLRARCALSAESILSRSALCDWLQEQAAGFGSGPMARANIERLRAPETVAVVATLRPNLFGGSLSCWLKAITAARLAGWITENCCPAVPLVWVAPVISSQLHVGILSSRRPRQLAFHPTSVDDWRLPDLITDLLSSVSRAAEVDIEDSDVLKILRSTHNPGTQFNQAWGRTLSQLLDFCGLIFFDPVGRTLIPWMQKLSARLDVAKFYAKAWEQRRRLSAAGYEPEEAIDPEAHDIGAGFPPSLFLPAVAMVVEESEMLESAVNLVAHSEIPFAAPVLWPRVSATLLTSRDQKKLDCFNLDTKQLLSGSEFIIDNLMQNINSDGTSGRLHAIGTEIERELSVLTNVVPVGDRLQSRVARSRRRMLHQVDKLNRRFQAAQQRRREALARHVEDLCNALAPGRRLQERELAGFQFVFRHSRALPWQLYERTDPWSFEHQLIQL